MALQRTEVLFGKVPKANKISQELAVLTEYIVWVALIIYRHDGIIYEYFDTAGQQNELLNMPKHT